LSAHPRCRRRGRGAGPARTPIAARRLRRRDPGEQRHRGTYSGGAVRSPRARAPRVPARTAPPARPRAGPPPRGSTMPPVAAFRAAEIQQPRLGPAPARQL